MMTSVDKITARIEEDFAQFGVELADAHSSLRQPSLLRPGHHYHFTFYAYVMVSFSFVDLWSVLWRGEIDQQTTRMVEFLERYFSRGKRVHKHAVQLLRHTLMHTSRPRVLSDSTGGRQYPYLLHWSSAGLPAEMHYTVTPNGKFVFGLEYFVSDMSRMLGAFIAEVRSDAHAQTRMLAGWSAIERQMLR
jgi:hypothetical protein